MKILLQPGISICFLLAVAAPQAAAEFLPDYPSVDKGDFQYSNPPAARQVDLNLDAIERQVASQAATRCGTPLAAAPLDLGDAEGFMSKVLGKAAQAAVGQLIGGLLGGGGGGGKKKPKLAKDPIRKKYKGKIEHPTEDVRIRIGGQSYQDGLLLSARVDKARGKGTFHTMFLEQPDCTRYWPDQYVQYGLWGSWSLSVSVTQTSSRYRDGQLVDRSVARSNWSRSGNFDFSKGGFSIWDQLPGEAHRMILDADQAYLTQLRREIDMPAWQAMGYDKPTEGIRAAGGVFRLDPSEITPATLAVVHITRVEDGRYRTVGFPLRFVPGEDGRFGFQLVTADAVAAQ
ncbi:MAG: hypothetical protein AAF529_02510 [Pseudomonadota bacterium]